MTEALPPPGPDQAPPPPGPGAEEPRETSPWIRLWTRWASLLILVALPPDGAIAQTAIVLAALAFFVTLWPGRDEPTAPEGRRSWLLATGGLLMLIGPFLNANPWCGGQSSAWPWTWWLEVKAWGARADLVLWAVAGAWAAVAGLSRTRGPRALAGIGALLLLVAARAQVQTSAFALVRFDRLTLLWTIGTAMLGGGFAVLAAPSSPVSRRLARGLLLLGVLAVLAQYALWFPTEEEARGRCALQMYADNLREFVNASLLGGEADATARARMLLVFWRRLAPAVCQAVGLILALLLCVLPSRAGSRWARWLAAAGWVFLLGAFVVSVRAGFWFDRQVLVLNPGVTGAQLAGDLVLRAGLPIWLAGGGALAGLVALASARAPGAPPLGPADRRWPWLLATAAAVAYLFASFRPERGFVALAWPWDVLTPLAWSAPTAAAYLLLLVLALLALRGGVGRGAALAALAGFMAVVAQSSLMPLSLRHLDVDAWVPWFGMAAASAAAAAAARGSGRPARVLAGVGGTIVLLLLLYPLDTGMPTRTVPNPPYESSLLHRTIGAALSSRSLSEGAEHLLRGPSVSDLLAAVIVATSWIAAVGARGRWLARVAEGAFVLAAFYVVFRNAFPEQDVEGRTWTSLVVDQSLGFLRMTGTPFLLAVHAATASLLANRHRAAGTKIPDPDLPVPP